MHAWLNSADLVTGLLPRTGDEKYRDAVHRAIDGVTRKAAYLFDETGAGRKWGANAYFDSIEGALVPRNRLADPRADEALDATATIGTWR